MWGAGCGVWGVRWAMSEGRACTLALTLCGSTVATSLQILGAKEGALSRTAFLNEEG